MIWFFRKLLFWAVLFLVVFFGFDYYKTHTSPDFIAYKRFAEAIREYDHYTARQTSSVKLADEVFAHSAERRSFFRDVRVRFTYYKVISQLHSNEGDSSDLVVEQVSRVSSPGNHSLWGNGEVRMFHRAKLEKRGGIWRLVSFEDPAMR